MRQEHKKNSAGLRICEHDQRSEQIPLTAEDNIHFPCYAVWRTAKPSYSKPKGTRTDDQDFSSNTCAFDCEWVPCPDTARRLLALPAGTSDREAMDAVWAHYRRPTDDPACRPFLKLVLSKVVTIAAVFRKVTAKGPDLKLTTLSIAAYDEGQMIAKFLEYVAGSKIQLWGFNSAGADLPILKQRAIALDVPCPVFNKRPAKPWEGYDYHDARNSDAHMDILDLIGGYSGAAKPSLHELATACGIPGKLDVAGDEVAEMYLAGRIADIAEYNETDAVTTHLMMLRIAHHAGHLTAAEYRCELEAVERLVQEQAAAGKRQMVKFLAAWDRTAPVKVTA